MTKRHLALLLLLSAFPGAWTTGAAEAVKLKPLLSIYIDGDGRGLQRPQGIGCGRDTVVVADTGNARLLLYGIGSDTVRPLASVEISQLPYPIRAELLSDGDILAIDGKLRRIVRVDAQGQFKGYVEIQVAGPGPVVPRSLFVDRSDRVYVLDVAGNRALVIDPSGSLERTIAAPAGVGFLSDLVADEAGEVYAVDSVARRVFVARKASDEFEPLGESLLADLDFPTSIAIDDQGNLFVVDDHGGGVVILGRDGSFRGRQLAMGWKNGFLRYPSDACVGGRNVLFLSERGNSRVQMFEIR